MEGHGRYKCKSCYSSQSGLGEAIVRALLEAYPDAVSLRELYARLPGYGRAAVRVARGSMPWQCF